MLCGETSYAEMAVSGRANKLVSRDFLKIRHSIPLHFTFSPVFWMIDPKALDAAFGRVLAQITVPVGDGDVIDIDGKALRGARDKGESARTRMKVSAFAARLRLTLATTAADLGGELEAALEVLGLIVDLSRFGAAPLMAYYETKEMNYGNRQNENGTNSSRSCS